MKKKNEVIKAVTFPMPVYLAVKKMAQKEKRAFARQAQFLIERALERKAAAAEPAVLEVTA